MRAGMAWQPTRHMLIERSIMPQFLSNTYLVGTAGRRGRSSSTPAAPSRRSSRRPSAQGLTPTHVLLTHHHHDHVAELGALRERWPGSPSWPTPTRRRSSRATGGRSRPGSPSRSAGCDIAAAAHAGPHGGDARASSSRATSSPATRCSRARSAACARPATRPTPTCAVDHGRAHGAARRRPSSGPATPTRRPSPTSGRTTRFIRVWRGLDPEGDEPCTALGEPATLVLLGDDYDGGHKAWVRWPDGRDDIVPGSQVRGRPPARIASAWPTTRSRPRAWRARRGSAGSPPGRRRARSGPARPTSRATSEAAQDALERRQLETAEQIVAALGTMKGAAMKLGQVMSLPRRRPGARGLPRGVPGQARPRCATPRPRCPSRT